jgi:inosose dehydratase
MRSRDTIPVAAAPSQSRPAADTLAAAKEEGTIMAVRLGVSPIAWSNDDLPELGGDTPLDTCLAEAAELGFAGIELGNKFPRDAAVLRPLLEHHRLQLISGWYSGRLLAHSLAEEKVAIDAHLGLLAAMGCGVLVYAETTGSVAGDRQAPLSIRPRLPTGGWPAYGRKLTELADHVARRCVRLAYHHHMGTIVETAGEIDTLLAATGDSVGLLLDTGHLAFADADPVAVAMRHRRRINHVHCKDIRPDVLASAKAADASFLDAVIAGVFTVPGGGSVDFAGVLNVLAASAYQGWLVVEAEQDPARAPPLAYGGLGYANLRAAAAEAGLLRAS